MGTGWFVDAACDLVTGSACVGCARPGRLLCAACAATLPARGAPAVVDPWPAGLVPTWAGAPHADLARDLVIGHKERGRWGLRAPLGRLLAAAVAAGVGAPPGRGRLLLCAVPSRPGTVRSRGHDATGAVVARAARTLRAQGYDAVRVDLLRSGRALDQGDLDAAGRAVNLVGTMRCPAHLLRAAAARHGRGSVVLCDDVVTTGATLVEAARALGSSGVPPLLAATVTSTPRRGGRGTRTSDDSQARSLPRVGRDD
ncbi:putative amidophosphoribosyltransferase [Nocardioides zeae]|uniref:Amidophosphoribosyltransferase n=1 Tax=Nocardioides zeae TaxID=1457234 RepID=A0ACC6IG76_9ACTN|nr:ComF family protein [Nocardioides zeae]MDR6176714.1 putative amidophosphoribosyltransferase [Nocardioides zeae]MDR6209726.1 putative amidophosphoribosyltransferase [Nocardioides zeae]